MPRTFANVRTDMWANTDFRAVSPTGKLLYAYLMSCPSLTYAGVADWRPARIAPVLGITRDELEQAAVDLTMGAYIWVDQETEEVLIRSFVRHDGLLRQPRLPVSMANDFAAIASGIIRRFFAFELTRLHDEEPELKAWSDPRIGTILKEPREDMKATVAKSYDEAEPNVTASVSPRVSPRVTANPSAKESNSDQMQPAPAPAPSSKDDVSATRQKPKRPIPADWAPNDTHRQKAQNRSLDLDREVEAFRTYAEARDWRLVNWDAGFSNWLTKARPAQTTTNAAPDAYIWGQRA